MMNMWIWTLAGIPLASARNPDRQATAQIANRVTVDKQTN